MLTYPMAQNRAMWLGYILKFFQSSLQLLHLSQTFSVLFKSDFKNPEYSYP